MGVDETENPVLSFPCLPKQKKKIIPKDFFLNKGKPRRFLLIVNYKKVGLNVLNNS